MFEFARAQAICGHQINNKHIFKVIDSSYCSGSDATRLYNPLGGAHCRSYGYAMLCRDSQQRQLSGVQNLATCVHYYERLVRGVLVLTMRLSACRVERTAIVGRL